jgi:integrase
MASCSIEKVRRGRYLVRWREPIGRKDGRTQWKARKKTVSTRVAATDLRDQILLALETTGAWEQPMAQPPAPSEIGDAEEAAIAYLRERVSNGSAASSIQRWGYALTRWFRTVREIHEISEDEMVYVTTFTRETFTQAKVDWRDEVGQQTIYMTARVARDLWLWIADDPVRWPGIPMPPRGKGLLPPPQFYAAPPAPRLEEIDAMIRWLAQDGRRNVSKRVAIVGRHTGLRISQILALQRVDLDVESAILTVRTGKTKRERAEPRLMPVSRHMIDDLADVLERHSTAPLVRCVSTTLEPARLHHPTATVTKAWEAVTAAGLARREVWDPPNRRQARPQHAFRAGYQAALRNLGAPEWVIDRLVGHKGSTRDAHYVDDSSVMDVLRQWVDQLPPIDWRRP